MKFFYWPFFLLNVKLFFHISKEVNTIYLCYINLFNITIQKSLDSNVNNVTYTSNLLFFLNEIKSNFIKGNININIILSYIIQNKILKPLFNHIFLNYVFYLLGNDLF